MKHANQKSPQAPAPRTNPGQIKIPIKVARFAASYTAPVGFKAGAQLEACSSKNPGNNHTIDFYPEVQILRVTWYPPRQPSVSFLVPSHHAFFLAEFSGDDTPQTPKG